jgi:sugar O-acyltransferase (sialic acid O-acetyltransferase NeuD family)
MTEVGLIGAGNQARETQGYYLADGGSVRWFAVTAAHRHEVAGADGLGAPLLTLEEAWQRDPDLPVVVALGYPGDRRQFAEAWPGDRYDTHVSPRAWIAADAEIGEGSVVCPGAVVNRSAQIGRHVLVNIGATVSHDTVVGDYVTVSPNAAVAGRVRIGEGAFLGIGAAVSEGITIGEGALVGAGAVVVRDVPPGVVVAGVPARVMRRLDGWP